MRKNVKINIITIVVLVLIASLGGCSLFNLGNSCKTAEKVELASAVLNEVEFKNSEQCSIIQECKDVEISGQIDAMTEAQKNAFAQKGVTHVAVIKMTFDKERTLDSVTIKGENTKVYSTNKNDENYSGSLTDLLDNKSGEDAYCNLILSANTKNYSITAKYTDGHSSQISVKISATLVTAQVES